MALDQIGARVFRGSIRLFLVRFGFMLLMSAPMTLIALVGVAEGPGKSPYFTEPKGLLPFVHLVKLVMELPKAVVPGVLVTALLCVFVDQILLGGAVSLADPSRVQDEKPRVLSAVGKEGLVHLWPFLRAVGLGLLPLFVGSGLLRVLAKKLNAMGELSGWTGKTMMVTLPMLNAVLMLIWFGCTAAWIFWCRLICAADNRRIARRSAVLALRVFVRRPIPSLVSFAFLSIISIVLSGAVLFGWRFSDPRGASLFFWVSAFLGTLAVQALLWLYLVRAGMLLYSSDTFLDLRSAPDESFRLWSRLKGLFRRSGKPAAAPAPAKAVEEPEEPEEQGESSEAGEGSDTEEGEPT